MGVEGTQDIVSPVLLQKSFAVISGQVSLISKTSPYLILQTVISKQAQARLLASFEAS